MNQLPLSPASQLNHISQFVATSLPTAAMLQSAVVDLRWDPNREEDPAFAEFDDNLLHELGHHVALWGALLRIQRGESTAWSSVGLNLARLLHRRQSTRDLVSRLPATFRQDPRGQRILSLLQEAERQLQAPLPLMHEIIRATGWQGAAAN